MNKIVQIGIFIGVLGIFTAIFLPEILVLITPSHPLPSLHPIEKFHILFEYYCFMIFLIVFILGGFFVAYREKCWRIAIGIGILCGGIFIVIYGFGPTSSEHIQLVEQFLSLPPSHVAAIHLYEPPNIPHGSHIRTITPNVVITERNQIRTVLSLFSQATFVGSKAYVKDTLWIGIQFTNGTVRYYVVEYCSTRSGREAFVHIQTDPRKNSVYSIGYVQVRGLRNFLQPYRKEKTFINE